jgi:hypothetical protein
VVPFFFHCEAFAMTRFAPLALLLALLAALTAGCVEERDPINRVQPLALKKSQFVGELLQDPKDDPEFWTQASVVDVGFGAAQDGLFTSTYAQPMSRIRWQITEDLLIGRLAYERIPGTDGKGVGKSVNDGVIVCAFRIQSHFDIQRSYNPTTGEEMNVVEENGFDRPWFQREFFRVDWSRNLNTDSYDFDTLSMLGIYGGVQYESMAFDITDPEDPNAPFFTEDGSYFDITNKAFARPQMIDLSYLGWGIDQFPACYLDADFSGGGAPTASCNPVELTLRFSFRKVVDNDFEPANIDGNRFQAYGIFYGERSGYARNYGMTDDKNYRMANRYNIWQRSHYYADPDKMTGEVRCYVPKKDCADGSCVGTPFGSDPNRDDNKDGSVDECAKVDEKLGVKGSRCDIFKQKCTLPFQARQAKPVAWYYADGGSPAYFQATEDATHEWDVAMRGAVQAAKYAECAGGSLDAEVRDACKKKYPIWAGQMDDNLDVIQIAREVDDCRHGLTHKELGRDEAKCAALADEQAKARGLAADDPIVAVAKMPEMVVLCHSPVEAGDPALCGPASQRLPANLTSTACHIADKVGDRATQAQCKKALHVRRGDLRYHQVNSMVEPQTPSPWGIMVDSNDPLTGETIAASINVWTHVNDLWSQGVVDMARYIAGELPTSSITEGKYIQDWSQAATAASQNGGAPQMTAQELARHRHDGKAMTPEQVEQWKAEHPGFEQTARAIDEKVRGVRASSEAPSAHSAKYMARAQSAAGTELEASLMTPAVQQMMGVAGLPMSPSLMAKVSPLQGGNPAFQRQIRQMKENALAARGTCIMEMAEAPLSLAGLATVLQEKFGKFDTQPAETQVDKKDPEYASKVAAIRETQQARAEQMRSFVARRAQYNVIMHEMGHSIGLRHNFVSSSDSYNYRPQYWQLRTKNGAVTTPCKDLATDGSKCVGPRYFDPVTPEESSNLIHMFMQSSVMDYAGETTQDFLGLGAYDFAAARMFYGDVVAVYDDSKNWGPASNRGKGVLRKMDDFGGLLGIQYDFGNSGIHYTDLQKNYAMISDCQPIDPKVYQPTRWDEALDGKFHNVLDGLMVPVDGQYKKCRTTPVDYVQWNRLRMPTTAEAGQYYRGGPAVHQVESTKRLRVPYGFATDNWADLGNVSVYRHDNGADPYEIFNFLMTQPEVNHIFDNYRRGRHSFSVRGAAGRQLGRYYEKLRDGAKGLGLLRNIYEDVGAQTGTQPEEFWKVIIGVYYPENAVASSMAFDFFAHVLARPQAGGHYVDKDGVLRSTELDQQNPKNPISLTVPNGATGQMQNVAWGGAPVENGLATNQGDFNSQFTLNAGSYYSKMYTSMLLTESVDNFISASLDDFTDARYRAVSMADLFPDGYRRMLANNLTGDDHIKGARVAVDAQGVPLVQKGTNFPTQAIGWTTWYGSEPVSCYPSDKSTVCTADAAQDTGVFGAKNVATSAAIDPQVGWEQQKFLIAWTLMFLPENQQQKWLDMMRIWDLGSDADPEISPRIEFHNPTGHTYVARTFGKETLFGKTVQKGIAARVLEYANELLQQAYVTKPGPDTDGDGKPDWHEAVLNPTTGMAQVKYDEFLKDAEGNDLKNCNANDNSGCTCASNRACMKLQKYVQVPFYLRQALATYKLHNPKGKGLW